MINVALIEYRFIFGLSSKTEVGSAEEQPTSDKLNG
jgi:hypothetical protein